jgi:hypothetical protein
VANIEPTQWMAPVAFVQKLKGIAIRQFSYAIVKDD